MSNKSKKRRLISELMEGKTVSDTERSPSQDKFFIHSSNSDFNARQRDIFTGLNQLEMMHARFQKNIPAPVESEMEPDPVPDPPLMDGNFKRPVLIPKRSLAKKRPDFVVHPERWTKYSLSDVNSNQMSDKSNTVAAMSFLDDCKRQKLSSEGESSAEDISGDPVDRKIVFQSRKFVMPEYTVGQKPTGSKNKKNITKTEACSASSNAVHLSHLESGGSDEKINLTETNELDSDPVAKNICNADSFADCKPKRTLRKRVDDEGDDDDDSDDSDE